MKMIAVANLPSNIGLNKGAYIVLEDGYYMQKVKLIPFQLLKELEEPCTSKELCNIVDALNDGYASGWNDCLDVIWEEGMNE